MYTAWQYTRHQRMQKKSKIALPLISVPVFQFQFSRSVVSDSLRPHKLQHARLPCLSPTPGAYSNSCPFHQWYYLTISSSAAPSPFAFNLCQLFASGGQSTGASASASVLLIQGWFPLGLTGLIPSKSKGLSRVFSSINSLALSPLWTYKILIILVGFS